MYTSLWRDEKMCEKDNIFFRIAEALLIDYTSVYYVNAVTNEYQWYSNDPEFHSLHIEQGGDDFFKNLVRDADKVIYEEDKHIFMQDMQKDNLLAMMKKGTMKSIEYRLMIDGKPVYHTLRLIRGLSDEDDYFILGVINVDKEVRARQNAQKTALERTTYNQIAESLASRFDVIYYIERDTGKYAEFTTNNIYGALEIKEEGKDFFSDAQHNGQQVLHPDDMPRILSALNKDYFISTLESKRQFSLDYRLIINGRPHYTRLSVMSPGSGSHFIVGVENIDDEVKKENEKIRALNQANELARRDELTGVKNKNAFCELEANIQKNLDRGDEYLSFAVVICDLNELKHTNDIKGHNAGDEMIRSASRLVCNVFTHSPVFRIGGDEFAVFLNSSDYNNRDALFDRLRDQVLDNLRHGDGPVLAAGMAVYDPRKDKTFAEVFERADNMMYEEKRQLKNFKYDTNPGGFVRIPKEEVQKLNELFDALELVSEGSYVYLCNMQYDYSKWSKAAVECFGLPSEYMYDANSIWEEHIHPEDKEIYHSAIKDIFTGNASTHDMQYRARKLDKEYEVCTCRGLVLRDETGKPKYFGGVIRNHGIHGNIDELTGLRNQYGFFEDLQMYMLKHASLKVVMVVINKFSELNEVYGYQFGNLILQRFARYLFENVGNNGSAYRLDGTKFAIISKRRTPDDIRQKYDELREYFRKGFSIDNKMIILDLSAGMLNVNNYDIDYQTVYACLNFAYSESKLRRQGELVEFYNNINDSNRERLEKIYAIRASIMQNYKGFYLLYQPVVDATTEKLIGAEALLRWKNDTYGMVPPDHFIPILEKDPLFCDLGQWILRTAINGAKLIMEDYPDFVINVNLSYTQLEKPDFVDMVLRTLKEEGFPPEHLCMEITERCRLLDMYLLKNVIINLRGHGIKIALDDFGTGFSSIGLVKNFPFDTIKIDRSFVLRIEEDEKERELIKYFAGVASTFGAKVCVEGIETEGMIDILQQYNIQSFQGYYYARPLELRDFLIWKPNKEKSKKQS